MVTWKHAILTNISKTRDDFFKQLQIYNILLFHWVQRETQKYDYTI